MTTSRFIAAELRAEIARAGLSQSKVATRLGVEQAWLSRRLSPGASGQVNLTIEEIEAICDVVDGDPEAVLIRALRARRDSNPKPSDSESEAASGRPRLALVHSSPFVQDSVNPRFTAKLRVVA